MTPEQIAQLSDVKLREKFVSNKLSPKDKEQFFQQAKDDNPEKFKGFLEGPHPYNIFEEISAPGYGWTVFHYAMHYGSWNIIKFIIEYLFSKNKVEIGFRLKSKDGRCPLLCLLKSNALKSDGKVEILTKIFENFTIPVSQEVIQEIKNREFDFLLDKIKPYNNNKN